MRITGFSEASLTRQNAATATVIKWLNSLMKPGVYADAPDPAPKKRPFLSYFFIRQNEGMNLQIIGHIRLFKAVKQLE
ncbi:MAG TPA: hypothetical protein VLL07_03660 [Pontiella sp.]|nr:hypothetical protein [Pontiella sp.]